MRILLVSDEFGYPENTGYRIRVANLVRTLDALGPVHWMVASRGDAAGLGAPVGVATVPTIHALRPAPRPSAAMRWVRSSMPWRIAATDPEGARSTMRRELETATSGTRRPFDLMVFTQIDTAEMFWSTCEPHCAAAATVVVDLNDLQSAKIAHQREAESLRTLARGRPSPQVATAIARALMMRVDQPRWARLEQAYARRRTTFVCSELDRRRLNDEPVVVANGVAPAPRGFSRRPDPVRPTVLFVGSMSYRPNADAAEFAARRVLPLIRRHVPDATLRLVGRGRDARVTALGDLAGVTVVGEVDDVAPELATAHLSLVPVRYGGGTRVKILESFAHAVPVVSTAIGAEGLAVAHDEHCLIADDAASLAAAAVRLLTEPAIGQRLTRRALALVGERYDAATIRAELATTLRAIVNDS